MAYTPRGRGGDSGGPSRGGDRGGFRGGRGGPPRGGRGSSSPMLTAVFRELLLKHSAQVELATEEVEAGEGEHQEVVAHLEEAAAEVQEEGASSVRKEAQRPSSYVYRLWPRRRELTDYTGTAQASGSLRCAWKRRHVSISDFIDCALGLTLYQACDTQLYSWGKCLRREEDISGVKCNNWSYERRSFNSSYKNGISCLEPFPLQGMNAVSKKGSS